ncbi:MAG TPA: PilZ domain-containing protein [Myxococcota bacterium]
MAKKRKKKAPVNGTSASGVLATAPASVEDVEAIEIDLDFDDEDVPQAQASRRAPRVPIDERVELSGFFGDASGAGVGRAARDDRLADISLGGVFVETSAVMDVGDPVVLHLPLADGKKLRVSGRVRWVTPFGGLKDARPGMGIELVGLGGDAREALSALLRSRQR